MILTRHIADRLGVSGPTVLTHARRLGVGTTLPIGPKGTLCYTEQDVDQIVESIKSTQRGRPPKPPGAPKGAYTRREAAKKKRRKK